MKPEVRVIPDEIITKMQADMVTHQSTPMGFGTTSRYGVYLEDGKMLYGPPSTNACYGSLRGQSTSWFRDAGKGPVFLYTTTQEWVKSKPEGYPGCGWYVTKEKSAPWYEFILSKKSPWRSMLPYVNTVDPEYAAKYGIVFNDIRKIPGRMLYNFLIACRFTYEYPQEFWEWKFLVDEGVDPAMATLLALQLGGSKKNWTEAGIWHQFITGLVYPYTYRFMNGEPHPAWVTDLMEKTILFPVQEMWAYDALKNGHGYNEASRSKRTYPEGGYQKMAYPLYKFNGKWEDAVSILDAEYALQKKELE